MSTPQVNDSFIVFSLKEPAKDDICYDLLQKLIDYLQASLANPGAANGVGVFREGLVDSFVLPYGIGENGSGKTIGLFKSVNGEMVQIRLPFPGEIALAQGSGVGPLEPPPGWSIITDADIVARYNLGSSPNWKVAAVKYTGI